MHKSTGVIAGKDGCLVRVKEGRCSVRVVEVIHDESGIPVACRILCVAERFPSSDADRVLVQ